MKRISVLVSFCLSAHFLAAQINLIQQPGSIRILPTSVISPTRLITPAGIQTEIGTTFQNNMDVIYQNVDRSYVTTGLLLDYGLLLTDVAKFNGTLVSDNYANRSVWTALYSSLYFMKFNNNATLTTPAAVNTLIDNYLIADGAFANLSAVTSHYVAPNNAVVNLIGLHYQYEQFKTNAATSNLVYVSNNQIYDTPGRPASPYEIKDAFAIAPTTDLLQGNTHIFRLRSDLFLRNNARTISNLQADFSDGLGMRNVGLGTDVSVTYSSDSVKTIVFRLTYSDGQVLQSQAVVNVSGTTRICTSCRYISPPAPIAFPNASINFPVPPAQMSTGHVTVATAGTDGILDNPLIIVEGFDPQNTISYFDYLKRDKLGVIIDATTGQTLSQLLEANNYDLVFLNYDNGIDDIKRNAYLLENLIYWVNQQTAAVGSSQKNVVLGASMGGLVARYALRDMELRNVNHNTRLYCSLDSPHQGANVPLALQAAVRYLYDFSIFFVRFADLAPELKTGFNVLNSPAAQQMLTYQLQGQGESLAVNNTPHTNFLSDYNAAGMPRLWGIRTLAIANGSECAQTQGYSPYSQMLSGNGTQDLGYFLGLAASIWQTFATNNILNFFSGFISTKSDIKIDVDVRSLPDQQAQRIFYFHMYYKKEILWGLITSTTDMANFSFNSQGSMYPIDSNPGGIYNTDKFAQIPTNISAINLNPLIKKFDFIPTTSSLDIGSGTQTIAAADYLRTYSPAFPLASPKNVPFNNFFTNPLSNEDHATLNLKNANWLWQELQGTPGYFSCNYLCSNTSIYPTISGDNVVCSGSVPFTASNIGPGVTLTWNKSSNLNYVSGQGTTTYTVTSNTVGAGFVNVTPNGQCGAGPVISKNLSVGTGAPPTFITIGRNECSDQRFSTDFAGGASVYDWTIIDLGNNNFTFYHQHNYQLITGLGSGNYSVVVASACPSSLAVSKGFTVVCSGSSPKFAISPNPATSVINVEAIDQTTNQKPDLNGSTKNFEIHLLNDSGEVLKQEKSNSGMINLDVRNLKKGLYILHIIQEREIIRQKIFIE